MSRVVIYRWTREGNRTATDTIPFASIYEAKPAYERLLAQMKDPSFAKEGIEWGISCPELDHLYEEELAPPTERAEMIRRLRNVRLGQA